MSPADIALGFLVVVIWGVNFAVMKYCIEGIPPMLLGALRFILVALPAIFFVRAPAVQLKFYVLYGLTLSFGQPALLYLAIKWGMPSGLASLVLQSQAMFTLVFVSAWLKEPCRPTQWTGLALAAVGMALIGGGHGVSMPLAGFILTALAAAMWAAGNVVTRILARHGAPVDPLGFVAWSSLVPIPPFLLLSYMFEGPAAIASSLRAISWTSAAAVLFLSWAATLLGYAIWSRLLSRYRAGSVAPLSLLVPFIGLV